MAKYRITSTPDNSFKKGGERKKKKRDNDKDYRHIPITPEMQAEMPADEWAQYIQEIPEVYTTRTKAEQEARNWEANRQWLAQENYKRAPHLYLPDGSLRPQAAESADWVWQLGALAPKGLQLASAAMDIPLGAGVNVGGVLNTAMLAHGASEAPERIQDWKDVAEGKMDWKEATLKTGLTALELSPAYGATKKLLPQTYTINPWAGKLGKYNRVVGPDAIRDIQESGVIRAGDRGGSQLPNQVGSIIGSRITPYASFGKGAPAADNIYAQRVISQGKKPFIISTDRPMKVSTLGRHGKGTTQFPVGPDGKYMKEFPASEAKVFEFRDKPHWLKGYTEVPRELPGSPNSTIMKAGAPNPLEIVDAIVPQAPIPAGWSFSPLNLIPGYGKSLGTKYNAFRKFGNSMKHVQETKTLSPKGGNPLRKGRDQMIKEGNWAALNEPSEGYSGVYTAEFDFGAPGNNLSYYDTPGRDGVLIKDKVGNSLVDIPVSDPGLAFHRRLPFSTRYVPVDKQKLLDNKFQWATQGSHLQSLAEKYGAGLGYVSLLGLMGNDAAVDTYNKYTIDPIINTGKNIIQGKNPFIIDDEKQYGGAHIETELTPEEIQEYAKGGGQYAAALPQEQDGGIVTSLTDAEIKQYIKDGYIVEEIK